jgi:RNA polymerase sigma-70 factor (ECF subfamily)
MDETAPSTAKRIRLAREGNEAALDALLGAHRNYLRLLAATSLDGRVQGKNDASDVVQETLLKAYREFSGFRGTTEQEWLGWIRRILANTLVDVHRHYRSARRDVEQERSLDASLGASSTALRDLVPGPGGSPSQEAQRRELTVVLADALAELDADDQEVVVLRHLRGLDWAEVGRRTGRTPDAARMQWFRALRRLAEVLDRRES